MRKNPPGDQRRTLILALLPSLALAQGITLKDALYLADRDGYANRLAKSATEETRGQKLSSSAGFLPTVRGEIGAGATDDPLGAFGTRLGQRRVSMASFDPAVLNDPKMIAGWNAAVVAEVPLVNLDAWQGRRMASKAVEMRTLQEQETRARTHMQVIEAWTGAALAREAVATWEAALAVAKAHEKQALSVQRNEMINRSDVLMAAVKVGEVEASLRKARADSELAKGGLEILLGSENPIDLQPSENLPDSVLRAYAKGLPTTGNSLSRAVVASQGEVAQADLGRARAAFLPRVNGMARVDWKGHETPWQEDPSLSVGIVASWTLFRGGDDWGQAASARARTEQARTGLVAQTARESMELRSYQSRLESALDRSALASKSLEQAIEAHRITTRRFEEGVGDLTALFEAQAMETRLRLSRSAARQEAVVSLANLAFLSGRDPAELATLSR
jgi:outer membrane protein TolC